MQTALRRRKSTASLSPTYHPVLQRLFLTRGVSSDDELDLELTHLLPPTLKGINQAAQLLSLAIREKKSILVVGDFDADGATSSALSLLCLRSMGAKHVDFLVPNRFEFGYGLTPEIVTLAAQRKPYLIMTVDNGIASHSGIEKAHSLGIKVLVTDHHLPAETLPQADCIVNPNQPGCFFASKNLAGVGVVFYVMSALRALLRDQNWFSEQGIVTPNLAQFLDIVALGTIADVVPLDANNRRLVQYGLRLMRTGKARPGISALLRQGNKDPLRVQSSDLGFTVGPRLNAAGRLDDMSVGIECLLTDDPLRADALAAQLDALNLERRSIEQAMHEDAKGALEQVQLGQHEQRYCLCLFNPSWHQGVIGILASRLKEKLHCPVAIFAAGNLTYTEGEDVEIKGSVRSISGVHIRDVLANIDVHHPGLILRFGGHAMAAGLTINLSGFEKFTEAFEAELRSTVEPELLSPTLFHDGELPSDCFSLTFAELLRDISPWGQHFPEPLFYGRFVIRKLQLLQHKHLKLTLQVHYQQLAAIAFNVSPELLQRDLQDQAIEVLFRLSVNEFRGQRSLQLMIEHFLS